MHAWGALTLAVGIAGVIATVLATLHANEANFRWWWPTTWMAVPAAIFVVGLLLLVLPLRHSHSASAQEDWTSIIVDPSNDGKILFRLRPTASASTLRCLACEVTSPQGTIAKYEINQPVTPREVACCYPTDFTGSTEVSDGTYKITWLSRADSGRIIKLAQSWKEIKVGHLSPTTVLALQPEPAATRELEEPSAQSPQREVGVPESLTGFTAGAVKSWTTSRTVLEWNASQLGVHRAATVDSVTGRTLPELTAYVWRAHDDRLRELLASAVRPVMVILVGGSSTGKTRAAFEAVRECLPDWSLLRPVDAAELVGQLTSGAVAPHTVLWLNESQVFLRDQPEVAASLRQLLAGSEPMAVVGTMWPQFWRDLTERRTHDDDERDVNFQARELLDSAVRVDVPETFADEDFSELSRQMDDDERLKAAAQAARSDGKVIQVLAGGPMLVQRYEHPADACGRYGKAVVSAAMDIRRRGHESPIAKALLEEVAAACLDLPDRIDTPDGWFASGLAHASDEIRGIAALAARRGGPSIGPADGYVLHDYLDQYVRTMRRGVLVSAAVQADLDRQIHAAVRSFPDRILDIGFSDLGSPSAIKYIPIESATEYFKPGQRLMISGTPGFTWGRATYVSPLAFQSTTVISGAVIVIARFNPKHWRTFDATIAANQRLYQRWLQAQPLYQQVSQSAYIRQLLPDLFRRNYQIDCVIFSPDRSDPMYSNASDVLMAVTDWTPTGDIATGFSDRFFDVRPTAVLE